MPDLRSLLYIAEDRLSELNNILLSPDNKPVEQILKLVERYGGPEAINAKARAARDPENLLTRLKEQDSPYVADLEWLQEQRRNNAFVSLNDYSARISGAESKAQNIDYDQAVTLEISALQYFPWLISQAKRAIEREELMPGRFIRVRNMVEQSRDQGDILATALAMQLIGASYVESLDTRGTDGSNIHLGGPETITGYFGGIGQPNDYPLKWLDEFLHYYTTYGIQQVLNVNSGTILAGYILHKLGVDLQFKISVFVGNDNPLALSWTLFTARLFSRSDGSTSLAGLNLSNSVNNETIRQAAWMRKELGLEKTVRFEHHITETCKSIVRQPYNRRKELLEIAREVSNISAKHEGADIEIEESRSHPSDILDYFLSKEDIEKQNLMQSLEQNYLDKHQALNLTAKDLLQAGIGVVAAQNLH